MEGVRPPLGAEPLAAGCRELRGALRRSRPNTELIDTLRRVSPGTPLREGMDSILRGQTGALIAVGDHPEVMRTLDGGFRVDTAFTPAALYELSKMDGGIVLSSDASRIRYANVQFNPDPTFPSHETGIRHRTAERMARQTSALMVAVSSRRSVITLYKGVQRYLLRDIGFILEKANEAVKVLDRYRGEFSESLTALTSLEFEDLVTVHDIATTLQRAELVLNVAEEIDAYAAELGTEGRLVAIRVSELVPAVEGSAMALISDYWSGPRECDVADIQERLQSMAAAGPLPIGDVARLLGYGGGETGLAAPVTPRGYRVLGALPRLPAAVVGNLVKKFGSLQRILAATLAELDEVEGVGEARARSLKENLRRMREQAVAGRQVPH